VENLKKKKMFRRIISRRRRRRRRRRLRSCGEFGNGVRFFG
jgi:hypothetical protein